MEDSRFIALHTPLEIKILLQGTVMEVSGLEVSIMELIISYWTLTLQSKKSPNTDLAKNSIQARDKSKA